LSGTSELYLGAGDDEVGAVTIEGAPVAGPPQIEDVETGAALNASDGSPVILDHAMLTGGGATGSLALGPLTSVGGEIDVGGSQAPAGGLTDSGGVTLDSSTTLKLAIDGQGVPALPTRPSRPSGR
jgi:hypothetical protein